MASSSATKRKLPEFRHVKAVGGVPFWYDFEEGKMIININDTHNFIISYYNKANEMQPSEVRANSEHLWSSNELAYDAATN